MKRYIKSERQDDIKSRVFRLLDELEETNRPMTRDEIDLLYKYINHELYGEPVESTSVFGFSKWEYDPENKKDQLMWDMAEKYLCKLFDDMDIDCEYVGQFPRFDKILDDIVYLMKQYDGDLHWSDRHIAD